MLASKVPLNLFVALAVFIFSPQLPAQIQWQKHSNPVLEVGSSGSWDQTTAVATTVLFHQGIYKMWYEGDSGFGYATSPDGLVWIKDTLHNPILEPGPPGSWDEMAVNNASVLIHNSIYHLWYSGVDANHDNRIGHATSPDGIFWTKDTANPVLDLGTTAPWDTNEAMHPCVIYEDNLFKMFYNGYGSNTQRILYAYSSDGTDWTGYTAHPMLQPGSSGSWDDWELGPLAILHDADNYHMWYTGWDDSTSTATIQIGYAASSNGLSWTRGSAQPVLSPGNPGDWDSEAVGVPSVILESGLYKMWYGGFDGSYYQTGYATAPPNHIEQHKDAFPVSYQLFQNFPNPFNPTTLIGWQLAVGTPVRLAIYDLTGREVAILVNEKREAGYHQVRFYGNDLASGIYLYRLQAGQEVMTRKMILMK